MVPKTIGGQPFQTKKADSLSDKMLVLAQNLLLEEIQAGSLFACGSDFTSRAAGRYGLYETFAGEVISFQPKALLKFTLSSEGFVTTTDLATVQVITRRLDHYELLAAAL